MLIDSPHPYSAVAAGLMKQLGIDPVALQKPATGWRSTTGSRPSTFFDKETFGADRLWLAASDPANDGGSVPWKDFLAKAPLDAKTQRRHPARAGRHRSMPMPGLTSAQKKDKLSRISYLAYLRDHMKCGPKALAFYQTITHDEWGTGIDAEPALDCWGFGLPGFKGLKLEKGSIARMGYTAAGYEDEGSPTFHFPDGNATIARLLVRNLIPDAIPGRTRGRHGHRARRLFQTRPQRRADPHPPAAARLSARATSAPRQTSPGVEVAYSRGGKLYRVYAANCVLAGWNMMIPYHLSGTAR